MNGLSLRLRMRMRMRVRVRFNSQVPNIILVLTSTLASTFFKKKIGAPRPKAPWAAGAESGYVIP